MWAEPGTKGKTRMTVILYLVLSVILSIVSVAIQCVASAEASGLRERDWQTEPRDERQDGLLGACRESVEQILGLSWMLVIFGYALVFIFALTVDPLRQGWELRQLPVSLAAIGLGCAVGLVVASRAALRQNRRLARQYDEIQGGKEPEWASTIGIGQAA